MHNYLIKRFKTATIVFFSAALTVPAIAHNVEISGEVAATFHIEPNHNPQANKPSTAWFALTRRGGSSIPLAGCNCNLKVYKVPRVTDAPPVLQPQLMAIDVEKYQDIPSAEITFPQAGAYELEISGTAKDESFSPFELTYTVNVIP
ncbi:MAG: hypothetical protein AAF652_01935 [Cyanobacteria bacterium P01_C01_bin.72]